MLLIELTVQIIEQATQPRLAIAPFVIPLVMFGVNAIGQGIKAARAKKQVDTAEEAISNYKRQKLENVYEGASYYNAAARQFAQRQINQNMGNAVSAAKQGGARSAGVAVQAQDNTNRAALQQAAQEQQAFNQYTDKKAMGQDRVMQMQEARENQDIKGLAALYAAGKQDQNSAINGLFEGTAAAAGMWGGLEGTGDTITNNYS